MDDFDVKKMMGKGQFARVFKALHKPTNTLVALKKVKKCKDINVEDEISIHGPLEHEHIVRLYGCFSCGKKCVVLVLELVSGGELFDYLQSNGPVSERMAARFAYQVTSALSYLHDNDVVHRDIKPENLLLTENMTIKIADFGLAAKCKRGETRRTYCGTTEYLPPEMICNKPYDHRVDVWTVGVLLYELIVGDSPFMAPSTSRICSRIRRCDLQFDDTRGLSEEAADLITRILRRDPDQRPSLEEIAAHPFILQLMMESSDGSEDDESDAESDSDDEPRSRSSSECGFSHSSSPMKS